MNKYSEEYKAFERFEIIVGLLKEVNDRRGLTLVHELVVKCSEYIQIVVIYEELMTLQGFRKQNEVEVMEERVRLDSLRRIKHEALISQLVLFNRYLFKIESLKGRVPIGGIFSLDDSFLAKRDRNKIASWAGYLVNVLKDKDLLVAA